MKTRITETVLWLLVACFCLLQVKLLVPHFCIYATDLEEFDACGTTDVMGHIIGLLLAALVFLRSVWKTLGSRWRNSSRKTAIEQSQWIRHWVLLITAIPGTLMAFYFIYQINSIRI